VTETRLDVLAIGDAVVDVIAEAEDSFLEREGLVKGSMQVLDAAGATRLYAQMGSARETSGGSAANTMAGIAALGGRAGFVGQVSNDQLGEIFSHDIRALGVEFLTPPRSGGEPTGRCLILVTPDAQRTMNTYLGVSSLLSSDDLDEAAIRHAAGRNGVAMLRVAPAPSGGGIGLGSDIVRVSVDGSDIQAIERRIETRFQAAQGDAFGMQWRDEGYWLLFPLALLGLLWFRRGTTVAWVAMLFVAVQALPASAQGQPHHAPFDPCLCTEAPGAGRRLPCFGTIRRHLLHVALMDPAPVCLGGGAHVQPLAHALEDGGRLAEHELGELFGAHAGIGEQRRDRGGGDHVGCGVRHRVTRGSGWSCRNLRRRRGRRRGFGEGVDIEPIASQPAWTTDDLIVLHPIGTGDQRPAPAPELAPRWWQAR